MSGGRPADAVLLLDTCALLDLAVAPERVRDAVREALSDPTTGLLVSSASAWEVAIKTRQGRLPGGERLLSAWDQTLLDLRAEPLVIDPADAIRAGGLSWTHRDPFDRMLVAQAMRRNVAVVTSDRRIIDGGIVRTIDTRA